MLPSRPNPEDNGLFVEFFDESVEDPEASKLAGAKQWKDKTYVRIVVDAFSTLEVPVRHSDEYSDINRFPDAYKIYEMKKTDERVGTPLKYLPGITPAKIKNYEAGDIYSVEQLASLPDNRVSKFMGGLEDRKAAVKFCAEAKESFKTAEVEKKFEAAQAQMDSYVQKLKDQEALIEKLMAAKEAEQKEDKKGKNKDA